MQVNAPTELPGAVGAMNGWNYQHPTMSDPWEVSMLRAHNLTLSLFVLLLGLGGAASVAADPPGQSVRVPRLMFIRGSGASQNGGEVPLRAQTEPQMFETHLREWACGFQWIPQPSGPGMMSVSCYQPNGAQGALVTLSHQCTDGRQGFEAPSILTLRDSAASGGASTTLVARCDWPQAASN